MFVCEKCGCNDERYFGIKKDKIYCRRCISFSSEKAIKIPINLNDELKENLSYSLSLEQEDISTKTKEAIANKRNVLIYAVCGAGKTEIVYASIADCLRNGRQVGFAIPRKDVVIELEERIKNAFPDSKVVSVYGGHTNEKEGDIIILTTHQLYRYKDYFDLLIIDETDAFPFSSNEMLMYMFKESIRGNYIMMSATPLKWMIDTIKKENGVYLKLMKRYHGHPLIVPKVKIIPFFKTLYVIKKLQEWLKKGFPVFIFCPTIDECEGLYNKIKLFIKEKGDYVHSKREDRNDVITSFKCGKLKYLVTTSVLERGVTVRNIQVMVISSDSNIYSSGVLIQISGRVGRKIDAYDGEVIYVADKETSEMKEAIEKIKEANEYVDV